MPDDMARALGTPGPSFIMIDGKECQARPLTIQELTEVERYCLDQYKRCYLKTFSDNADLLPKVDRMQLMSEKLELAARWDVDDLPVKHAHDPASIVITGELRRWLTKEYGLSGKIDNAKLQRLCATSLDQGSLGYRDYKHLTKGRPRKVKVPYVSWWITGSFDGMVTFIWMAFKQNGVTREQVATEMGKSPAALAEMAREIERLSSPAAGNG